MITSPASPRLPSPPAPGRWPSTPDSRHILVVDDDPLVRTLVSVVLGRVGYRVSCADDGEAGWGALCAEHFDLMITDHDMPRLTGLELLRRVRARLIQLPVILASGKIPWHEPDLLPLLPPGLALAKPFLPLDLLAKVRSFLTPGVGATDHGQRRSNSLPGGSIPQLARAMG